DQQGGGVAASDLRARLGLGSHKSSASAPPAAKADDRVVADWYYSKDGQSFGPFGRADLIGRFESGELGAECYVWHRDLRDWLPEHAPDPLSDAIALHQAQIPPPPPRKPFESLAAGKPASLESMSPNPSGRVQSLKDRLGALHKPLPTSA